MDSVPDALIGSASAEIAVHSRNDFIITGIRVSGQQCSGGHDLTRLTKSTLGHIFFEPGPDERVAAVSGNPFNGRDAPAVNDIDGRGA